MITVGVVCTINDWHNVVFVIGNVIVDIGQLKHSWGICDAKPEEL